MYYRLLAELVLIFNYYIYNTYECSINHDDIYSEKTLQSTSVSTIKGFFVYRVSCSGRLVSIRARGYCPEAQNNSTEIVLQVINSTLRDGDLVYNKNNITAKCNSTTFIDSNYSEGYISIDNLDIIIPSEGYLSVRFDPNCSCYFQPLLINTTGKHYWYYLNDELKGAQLGYSLFFSAEIISINDNKDSYIVPLVLSVIFILMIISIILVTMCLWKRMMKKKLSGDIIHQDCPYDYVRYTDDEVVVQTQGDVCKGHYEFDTQFDNKPFWEPACVENKLKTQLLHLEILPVDLRLSHELGSGEFGVVKRGMWSVERGEKEVAVKCLADNTTEEKRIQFLQEAAIMCQFKHPNVITLFGVLISSNPLMIIVELMEIGDLCLHLSSLTPQSQEESVSTRLPGLLLSFCRQICSGMTYLSGKGFIHRDLATRNILVSEDEMCKIADFGMSRTLKDAEYYLSHGGKIPVKWTAPEALGYKKYSIASDIWSFGIVLFEIWSFGAKPYKWIDNMEIYKKIERGYRLPPPPGCPNAIYQTMIECWAWEADMRPTFPQIQTVLQRPDFKLLTWTPREIANYSEEARMLGAPLEAGEELYPDIQMAYT